MNANEKMDLGFVGLRSKMYSLLVDKDCVKKTFNRIKKSYQDKQMRQEMYREISRMWCSGLFVIETMQLYKTCLSPCDDKLYVLDVGVNTLA